MRVSFVVLLAGASHVAAHMPAFAQVTSRQEPLDLGDITKNSWAITGYLSPGQVQHYKFTIESPTTADSPMGDRFYMGMYVPGEGQPGFRYYVAIFGLSDDTECERWGDGWGRRLAETPAAVQPAAAQPAAQPSSRRSLLHPPLAVHRMTSEGTTWLASSDTYLPEEVIGPVGEAGVTVDYHSASERLIFIADPDADLPVKFEPFSPTLFRPRGSCITDFKEAGEYRIAVWSDDAQTEEHRFSLGVGLTERDVFSAKNLLLFDFTLLQVQAWNGWSPFVLLLPLILAVLLVLGALYLIKRKAPTRFGTASGWPTPFRTLVCVGGAMISGHVIANLMIFGWATGGAHVESTRELVFPLMVGIVMPTLFGLLTLGVGLRICACCACCCGPPSANASCGQRAVVAVPGVLHLMLHAGYIIGPALLLTAALLPPAVANAGLSSSPPHYEKEVKKSSAPAAVSPSADAKTTADQTPSQEAAFKVSTV